MPTFKPDTLLHIGYQLFTGIGCSPEDARTVADHLVESSLFGHDSHGVIRLYEYVGLVRDGVWDPRGTPHIVDERPCTAVIDGGGAMGQVGAAFAAQVAMDKARENGTATVTLRNCRHVGRCGAYPLMIARQGFIGLMFVNAGRLGRQITPYGGLDGKLSTNPIAFAAPRRQGEPIMVDMATSMSAEGKVRVANNKGAALPEGFIIDHQGNPSTDPQAFLGDPPGAILPLGGTAAHKGYCLSMMVELLGGALGGEGCANGAQTMDSNGVLLMVYHIEHFTDLERFYDEVEILVDHVHSSRIDPKVGEILLPGEPEFRSAAQRRQEGIPIDETTWSHICDAARALDLDPDAWQEEAIHT
jgi:uncharacterized oxidoreductase